MKKILTIALIIFMAPLGAWAAVELDADSNGATDIGKGGTNATTAANARTALSVPAISAITWATATAYTANTQSVTHGGHVFVCISSHTSSAAGAVGNEPGVGDSWATKWKYHGSDLYAAALGANDNYVTDAEKTRIGELEATDSVSFGSVTATGSGGLVSGVQSTTQGGLTLYSNVNAFVTGILPAATPTGTWSLRLPPAAPGGANYLFNVDADGTGGWTDPSTLGGDNLGSATYSNVVSLWTTCSGYLKSDGTCDSPTGTGDMVLATAQTVTGKKTFENSDLALLGSSTGATTFASANASATDYTLTFPAVTSTLLAGLPSADNQLLQATGSGTYAWTSTLDGIGNITGAGSYNKITVTQPANGATLTLVDGSTLATAGAYTLTLTATADSTPTFPAGAHTVLATADVDDTPDNGDTTTPPSANWAYDHAALATSDTVVGHVEAATTAETNTGTSTSLVVTPDGLSGSVYGQKEIGWYVIASDTVTAVADGKQAAVVPASMNGMNLVDATCRIASPNGATGGATTTVFRRVRTGTAMGDATSQYDLTFSTPTVTVTWDGTGTDPGIANSAASLLAGDEVDLTGFTTAANNGHFTVATVGTNYITFSNASGVENLNDTGVTFTPVKHRDMVSTGVTVAYNEYTASDEVIDTGYDDLATGDSIYVDVTAVTSGAAQKGLSCTALFQTP